MYLYGVLAIAKDDCGLHYIRRCHFGQGLYQPSGVSSAIYWLPILDVPYSTHTIGWRFPFLVIPLDLVGASFGHAFSLVSLPRHWSLNLVTILAHVSTPSLDYFYTFSNNTQGWRLGYDAPGGDA
jgi:hypothetical protein